MVHKHLWATLVKMVHKHLWATLVKFTERDHARKFGSEDFLGDPADNYDSAFSLVLVLSARIFEWAAERGDQQFGGPAASGLARAWVHYYENLVRKRGF